MRLSSEKISQIWAKVRQEGTHWFSLYHKHKHWDLWPVRFGKHKYVNHPVLLWWGSYGASPDGKLERVCGVSGCVNPEHMQDRFDREQSEWKNYNNDEIDDQLEALGYDRESGLAVQVGKIHAEKRSISARDLGMTKNFHCYSCNMSFDPTVSENEVICDACWQYSQSDSDYLGVFPDQTNPNSDIGLEDRRSTL